MLFNRGEELEIQSNKYIVLNKCNEDGRDYLFVADVNHPDINLINNFDEEALKLLLISQDEKQIDNQYTVEKDQGFIQKILVNMYE